MYVAIIPARGGSKRIPGKNIRDFAGKPIIAYSIDTALKSGLFERIIVSTDSEQIAEVAISFGAEVPFRRSANISGDHIGTAEVVGDALEWLMAHDSFPEYACCIYPTAPFLQSDCLQIACKEMLSKGCQGAFPVTSFPFPIFRALCMKPDGHVDMFWPENRLARSQDFSQAYHDAGQFYWLHSQRFLKTKNLYEDAVGVIVSRHFVQDIDTPEDWEVAEIKYEILRRRGLLA